jgi:hypothetical protein
MRCRECAAEVAVTARVCSRCGAPIVGQPPLMVDTVVDAAVSDAAGNAVAAGLAGQAPPESYVAGSGARVPAELRLVLAGHVGVACGWFAGAFACAAAAVFLLFFVDDVLFFVDEELDDLTSTLLFTLACMASIGGLRGAFEAHRPRIPVAVGGASRVVDEGRHAGAR